MSTVTNTAATYTYWPESYDSSPNLPPSGTEVQIVTPDFTPGTRERATIADATTGHRYGTVPTDTLFLRHRVSWLDTMQAHRVTGYHPKAA